MNTGKRLIKNKSNGLLAFEVLCTVVVIALFVLVGHVAAFRALGAIGIMGAVSDLLSKKISYGLENREHSNYITGKPAFFISSIMGLVGFAMLLKPEFVLGLFGITTHQY